jgi:hypothetical protein
MEVGLVDEDFNINKPIVLARSEKLVPTGEYDYFNTNGWYIRGKVDELVVESVDLYQGFNIYRVSDVEYIRYYGVELSDYEIRDLDKLKRKGRVEYTPPYIKD